MTKKYTPEELATLAQSARKALNTRIPLTLHADLQRLSAETGTSIQDLVTDTLTRSVNARLAKIDREKNS